MSKQQLIKVGVSSSDVSRGLEGYTVLADNVVGGQRTLVLERPALAVRKVVKKATRVVDASVRQDSTAVEG